MSRRKQRKFAGSHAQSWLYGRHAVESMLEAGLWRPSELYAVDGAVAGGGATVVSADRLAELCGSREHQGAAARMPPYPYLTVDELLAEKADRVLVLDRVQYANNFGTILRSAEVFGFDAVLVPDRGQCELTAAVARMSAGAVFHLPVAREDNLAGAVGRLVDSGLPVWGTTLDEATACDAAGLGGRLGIVIGNEHDGVGPEVLAACSGRLTIPQAGKTQSLNAAASAAVLLYEVDRQRRARGINPTTD